MMNGSFDQLNGLISSGRADPSPGQIAVPRRFAKRPENAGIRMMSAAIAGPGVPGYWICAPAANTRWPWRHHRFWRSPSDPGHQPLRRYQRDRRWRVAWANVGSHQARGGTAVMVIGCVSRQRIGRSGSRKRECP